MLLFPTVFSSTTFFQIEWRRSFVVYSICVSNLSLYYWNDVQSSSLLFWSWCIFFWTCGWTEETRRHTHVLKLNHYWSIIKTWWERARRGLVRSCRRRISAPALGYGAVRAVKAPYPRASAFTIDQRKKKRLYEADGKHDRKNASDRWGLKASVKKPYSSYLGINRNVSSTSPTL